MKIQAIDIAIRQAILQQLQADGWVASRDFDLHQTYGMATKDYDSAVGVKTAQAYLWPADDSEWKLAAEYYSEGRNALSTTWFYFPVTAPLEEIRAGTAAFAKKVDSAVSKTYAVRLIRPVTAGEE